MDGQLNNYLALEIVLPEFLGGAAFRPFEQPVEVRQSVEPAVVTDFRHRHRGIDQQTRCPSKAVFDDVIAERLSRTKMKETTGNTR